MTLDTTSETFATDPRPNWEPALTRKEAVLIGIGARDYDEALVLARQCAVEHRNAGTPRHLWEPTRNQNAILVEPLVHDGELELNAMLEDDVDPVLDDVQETLDRVHANVDEVQGPSEPIITEGGSNYTRAEAVQLVRWHDLRIEQDDRVGRHHHRRAHRALMVTGKVAPWIEALGFLAFMTYYLNVPLLRPWLDLLGWTLAVTIVAFSILGQTWLVHHAATDHNRGREVYVDGHRPEGERAYTHRNRFLVGAAIVAGGITCGMIWRGLAALGDAELGTTIIMVFLATVAGVLMPTLAYLGTALDGSSASRERDDLAVALDDDLADYLETIESAKRDLILVAESRDLLMGKVFPTLCDAVQEQVDGVYRIHGIIRLLVGGLSGEPLQPTAKTFETDEHRVTRGQIGTSLPGARVVDLGPLVDRVRRLTALDDRRGELLEWIQNLPEHPWGSALR